jgi:hypothetical protein
MKSKFLFGVSIGMLFFGMASTISQPAAGWTIILISMGGIYSQAVVPGFLKEVKDEVWSELKPYYHNLKVRLFS